MPCCTSYWIHVFSNTTYSYCQVRIPKLYKRVTARSCGLNRLDGTMTGLQNIHWTTFLSAQCISSRHVIVPSNLYIPMTNSFNRHDFRWQFLSWPTRLDRLAIHAIACFYVAKTHCFDVRTLFEHLCNISTFSSLSKNEFNLTQMNNQNIPSH